MIQPEPPQQRTSISKAPHDKIDIDDAIERIGTGPFQRYIVIAAGLVFSSDSTEVLLLAFLGTVLQVFWGVTVEQAAQLTSIVFAGQIAGTIFWGPMADSFGRKPVYLAATAVISLAGVISAFATNFAMMAVFRFITGFGIGGLTVPFDALAEFLDDSHRGVNLLAMHYFWALGTVFVVLFAYLTLGTSGDSSESDWCWRIFVLLCSLPSIVSLFIGWFCVPESPRWLLVRGRNEEALNVLRRAARINGKDPEHLFPNGCELHSAEEEKPLKHLVRDLFSPQWRKITAFVWIVQICQLFAYYGNIELSAGIFSTTTSNPSAPNTYSFDYAPLFAASGAEVVGLTLVILLVERFGRIKLQAIGFATGAALVLTLGALATYGVSHGSEFATSLLARLFFSAAASTSWLTTAEVYNTNIRATGGSFANTLARIGGFLSPYLVASQLSRFAVGGVTAGVAILATVAVWQLPETTGRHMGAQQLGEDAATAGNADQEDRL